MKMLVTVEEACKILREAGFSICHTTLRAAIEQKAVDFGFCVITPHGSREFYVSRALLMRFIAKWSGEEVTA